MGIIYRFCICLLICLFSGNISGQKQRYSDYYLIRRNYENFSENDSKALPYIKQYVKKAKKEKNYFKLVQGYRDAVLYSSNPYVKLHYADSTIIAAKITKKDSLISEAYLEKGVVYYFQFKKYKLALDEYLKAFKYAGNTNDFYKNRLIYHIGVVKSYIGLYDEGLVNFEQTKSFFEMESVKVMHPNLQYGNRRGYLNSIHQMIVCYRNLGRYKSADSLTAIGLASSFNNSEYKQEYGYFLKERGIEYYREKRYDKAINSLSSALIPISNVNDFAWATVCYSFIGKSYQELNENNTAVQYFQKVDSVFRKHNFVLPDVRGSFERLINYYKNEKNYEKQLYFTNELIKVDHYLSKDFAYLSSKIHREYDTKELEEQKSALEKGRLYRNLIISVLCFSLIILLIVFILRYKASQKVIRNYTILKQKIIESESVVPKVDSNTKVKGSGKLDFDESIAEYLVGKLGDFELNLEFLEHGLTLARLSEKFDTNVHYLSDVINEFKGKTFNKYLNELRIKYITEQLYNDKKFRSYKIETLAEICGIASRGNFSDLFQEINGMRPTEFIKRRRAELEKEDNNEG